VFDDMGRVFEGVDSHRYKHHDELQESMRRGIENIKRCALGEDDEEDEDDSLADWINSFAEEIVGVFFKRMRRWLLAPLLHNLSQ